MKISICITTCNRPEGLTRLLESLKEIQFFKCPRPELEIVVVDNYVEGNAREICSRLQTEIEVPLIFDIETHRGITHARNKAISAAGRDSDFIAFLDDDQIPEPNWLDELLHATETYRADVVNGSCLPLFSNKVPQWIVRGGFFNRERYTTGYVLSTARTGNVLIRNEIFRKINGFDHRFALTGGEDEHFFTRAHREGFKIIWSDEATVYECVPETRMNPKWILRRAFRTGNSHSRCQKYLRPSIYISLFWAARGFCRITKGLIRTPFALFIGKHHLIKALQPVFNGAGLISGILGISFEEYRQIHGK